MPTLDRLKSRIRNLPILPYRQPNPTSGYSGTDTSAARAYRRDGSGATAHTQARILTLLVSSSADGVTVAEARAAMPESHHGTISGTLSALHKTGAIARLAQKRGGCKIYVLPELVGGRKTEAQGHR